MLTGRVGPGLGYATGLIRAQRLQFRVALGVDIYPGTLNVYMADEWRVPESALVIQSYDSGRSMFLVPCTIRGTAAWIMRPFIMEFRGFPHPRSVIELVSEVKLRDAHDLADGDVVEVHVER